MSRGFTLIEMLVVVAIIAVLMGIVLPLMQTAMLRAHVGTMASNARIVQNAFKQHFIDYNMYPNDTDAPAFEPLLSEGYYDGRILARLLDEQADDYESPDDDGINQEFWLEVTLDFDPSVRFLVADSNDAPLSGGDYVDGILLYKDGVLKPLTAPIDH